RAVIGDDNVAKLEDFVYGVEDGINRRVRRKEAPKAYWSVPASSASTSVAAVTTATTQGDGLPPFRPKDPGPALKSWSAPGDGVWVPITDPRRPEEPPYMMKTLLHPDGSRGWAEVFIVAVDLRRVKVFPIAGKQEPKADRPAAESYVRTGVIPERHHEEL